MKIHSEKSNTNRWTCTNKTCYASITTNSEDEIIKINGRKMDPEPKPQLEQSHEHGPQQEIYIDTLQSLNNLKLQSKEKTTSTLSSIYNDEQTKLIQKHG